MVSRFPLLLAAFIALAPLSAEAATRLVSFYNGGLVEIEWAEFPVTYRIDQRVLSSIPGGSAALDRAFASWSAIPQSNISFRLAGVGNGLRAGQDGQSIVTMTDDLFRDQKALAVTTTWDTRGVITEADIQIDAALGGGGYNIQQALTHEIGHLLGLDHSGVLSAVMFPYVPRGEETPVLDSDDRIAVAAMYPQSDPSLLGGTLTGRVTGDSGGIFGAQVVAVNAQGEPVATALTRASGEFVLQAIPAGSYRLYAEPLDGPVEARHLGGAWRQNPIGAFPTQFLEGEPIRVEDGKVYGNLIVRSAGAVRLNPKWVGVSAPGSSLFNLTSTAVAVKRGNTVTLAVAGDGITGGLTTFEVLNPGFTRKTDFRYASNYLYAEFEVGADAPEGSAVILVKSGLESATLTGALRVTGGPGRMRIVRR